MPDVSYKPQLRPLEIKWLDGDGRQTLYLRDPTGLAPSPGMVPAWVALLLGFFDGERDVVAIRAAFELRTGQPITADRIDEVVRQLDEALFLDSPRFRQAQDEALRSYRNAAFRPPSLADKVYPGDPTGCVTALRDYGV